MVNAQRLARLHPDTFEVPAYWELQLLKVGDDIKVCSNNERFWVRITGIIGKTITGIVSNNLWFNELKFGDVIEVRFSNVFDIIRNYSSK